MASQVYEEVQMGENNVPLYIIQLYISFHIGLTDKLRTYQYINTLINKFTEINLEKYSNQYSYQCPLKNS